MTTRDYESLLVQYKINEVEPLGNVWYWSSPHFTATLLTVHPFHTILSYQSLELLIPAALLRTLRLSVCRALRVAGSLLWIQKTILWGLGVLRHSLHLSFDFCDLTHGVCNGHWRMKSSVREKRKISCWKNCTGFNNTWYGGQAGAPRNLFQHALQISEPPPTLVY